nr:hypothetical protein [Streptomyces chartreusis]
MSATGERWPVKEATRRYAEELRGTPGTASADGHAGWECTAGASLIAEGMTPGPGRLGTLHGVIYVCPDHEAAAGDRMSAAGYRPQVHPAPPGHRHNPWPCGHITAYSREALAVLTGQAAAAAEVAARVQLTPDDGSGAGWDPDDPYGDVAEYERGSH